MAYSMLECPKLHNAKSFKFYPEEYDHHVSFRHKNLPPDFEFSVENCTNPKHARNEDKGSCTVQAQSSTHKKCPIYIHNFGNVHHTDGDFVPKNRKKSKNNRKSVIEKLEETYWANWKPDKNDLNKSNLPVIKSARSPEIQIIKSAPERRRKIQVFPYLKDKEVNVETQIEHTEKLNKPQEEPTDSAAAPPTPEETTVPAETDEEAVEVIQTDEPIDSKFLKHTDSFILNVKKQKEEKEHFDQPKCIRLYRKPAKISSKNFVKGGSYPLKSCMKKESTLTKGSSKLGRPGSPIIVSSNFSTKGKHSKSHRH